MRAKNLPIYAKLRTSSGLAVREPTYATIPLPTSIPTANPVRPSFEVLTVAGRQDQVTACQGLNARGQRVPVWRSGFRNGKTQQALFNKPTGLVVNAQGTLYVADTLNHCIRKVSRQGRVSTLAGSSERGHRDGPATQARFNQPTGLALDNQDCLYVVDSLNHCLRQVSPQGETKTLPTCGHPLGGIACGPGGLIYFSTALNLKQGHFITLARLHPSGHTELLSKQGDRLIWQSYHPGDENKPFNPWFHERKNALQPFQIGRPVVQAETWLDLTLDRQGHLYFIEQQQLFRLSPQGELQAIPLHYAAHERPPLPEDRPAGLAMDEQGHLYVVDNTQHCIRRITPEGRVVTVAGYRSPETPWNEPDQFYHPQGIAIDPLGRIFVSDTGNWRICQLIPPEAQWHKRLNYLPWLPVSPRRPATVTAPREGVFSLVSKSLRRLRPVRKTPAEPTLPVPVPVQHLQDVLQHGSRSQQLAAVREILDLLRLPGAPEQQSCQSLLARILSHEELSIRALVTRELCDLIQTSEQALLWVDLLEKYPEQNRMLRKYRIDILAWIGQTWLLYGQVVPLLVDFIRDAEQDVVNHAFERLLQIRQAGYESLVDPLVEELTR